MSKTASESGRGQNLPGGKVFSGRMVGSFAAAIFAVAILLMSFLAVSNPSAAFPNETDLASESAVIKEAEVRYYLPYPGILPDNVLYRLKMVRDKASLALTFDKAVKAEKELLYADKRINAAIALFEGGKQNLAVSTATKAEKYLEQSVNRVISLQKEGRDVKSMLLKMKIASAKHEQILIGFRDGLDGNDRQIIERTILNTKLLREKISQSFLDSK